jgi:hypothetical protein
MQFRAARTAQLLLLAVSVLLVACASHLPPSPQLPPHAGRGWFYEVAATGDGRELLVHAWFPGGALPELSVRAGAERFVRDVEVAEGDGWRRVAARGTSWLVPRCGFGACRLRYRFLLREAAEAIDDPETAVALDGAVEAPPSAWLLHPMLAPLAARFRFHVAVPEGTAFATGVFPAEDGTADTYEADAVDLFAAPYSVFGSVRSTRAELWPGVDLELLFAPGKLTATDDEILAWTRASARAVAEYFGCFPVPRAMLLVVPVDGDEVERGLTIGEGGASIIVEVGHDATAASLEEDWVLPHELVHLGFPSVSPEHHWIEEGVAVYVQPIARARAGQLPPDEVWKELVLGLPKGLPRHFDRGLDHTRSWGRTYWGGALFCLLADVEIRRRTQNRYSFDDALRGIIESGGNIAVEWDLERALDAGDAAVGVPVLRELYAKMGSNPMNVDLAQLWKRLGVEVSIDSQEDVDVRFDDAAPLSALRRAITEAPSPSAVVAACPRAEPAGRARFVRK